MNDDLEEMSLFDILQEVSQCITFTYAMEHLSELSHQKLNRALQLLNDVINTPQEEIEIEVHKDPNKKED